MSELEEWQNNNPSADNKENEGGREGYRSFKREGNGCQRPRFNTNGGNGERPRRPRFNSSERGYNNNNQQGFRPEGFGRNNGNNGGYGQRPQYNNNRGGFGGNGYDDQGGYRPRQNSFSQGYRQGNNDGGYNQRGGYNNGGGYNQRGGYNNQRGGNFGGQRGGYNNQRGGYNNQRGGGYNNQRGGGFGGGYNNQRNQGFKQRGGGYNPNAKYSQKKRIEYKEYIEDPDAPIRLNKFLANAGVCSRREADQFIQAGVVKVNGEIVTELGTKVQRTDTIHFHDQLVTLEKKVYVILNKPKDYVTTSDDPQQRNTVMELVKDACRERIYPVGRLDRNTTGVLLFTNDGDLASKLTHPKFLKKKIYHVYLDHNASAADLKQIADGITLEDGEVHADAISYASDTDKKQVGIEIHSGKNRIVRRIFESLGYRVLKLDRVMFAGLTKKGLKRGDWRYLTEQEVAMLHMGSFE